jgi:hypothetical protein
VASWGAIAADAPDFARRVRALFDATKHKTMATLRRDGSPRISGIEVEFGDDEIHVGMMPGSVKALDVARDPRLAVHSASVDPPVTDPSAWVGDAKLSGVAVRVESAEGERFRIEVTEVVLTYVGTPADHLVIESWHPATGLRRRTRA